MNIIQMIIDLITKLFNRENQDDNSNQPGDNPSQPAQPQIDVNPVSGNSVSYATFNKNNIFPDKLFEYEDLDIMGFLREKNCFLANYKTAAGEGFNSFLKRNCKQYNVNPKWVLVSLQREQSMIAMTLEPSKSVMDKALGFGVYDDGTILSKFQGFENQITNCIRRSRELFDNGKNKLNISYRTLDKEEENREVFPATKFTYLVYEYTPHVAAGKLSYDLHKRYWQSDLV